MEEQAVSKTDLAAASKKKLVLSSPVSPNYVRVSLVCPSIDGAWGQIQVIDSRYNYFKAVK